MLGVSSPLRAHCAQARWLRGWIRPPGIVQACLFTEHERAGAVVGTVPKAVVQLDPFAVRAVPARQ